MLFKWLDKLRTRLGPSGASLPTSLTGLNPPKLVERVKKATQAPYSAQQAAPWTEDIRRHNVGIDSAYAAEKMRRFTELDREAVPWPPRLQVMIAQRIERGEQAIVAREAAIWEVVEYQMWRAGRNADVTNLQPRERLLTAEERAQAAEASALRTEVEIREWNQAHAVPRPTEEEILYAVGGDEARAAQLRAKVNELFGEA